MFCKGKSFVHGICLYQSITVLNVSIAVINLRMDDFDSDFDFNDQCCKCFKRHLCKTVSRIKVISTEAEAQSVYEQLNIKVNIGYKLCDKCRRLVFFGTTSVPPAQVQPSTSDQPESEPKSSQSYSTTPSESQNSGSLFEVVIKPPAEKKITVELPIQRCSASHKYCCICKARHDLKVVPLTARIQCFNKLRIFIPKENRVCSEHLINNRFFEDDMQQLEVYSNTSFLTSDEITSFLTKLSDSTGQTFLDRIKSSELSEKQIFTFTSLKKHHLLDLKSLLTSMRGSHSRNIMQALVVCLFKLRTGSSNNLIASIFEIENEIKVSDICESVVNSFERDILPSNFGVNSLVREDLIQNQTSNYAKKLFNISDELVLIFDGTYLRHQKSKNNDYQRKSYSGHKKVPLCKPFTICTTNGFIVDMPGPFLATENDAVIMRKVMEDPNGIRKIMRKGDVCVVDRGFRDVVPYLEELGFRVLMPALKGKRSNLTTLEANESRFVTKLRWVVEANHGILGKKYQLLHHQLDNKLLPKAGLYVKIACFLNNRYGKRLNSDQYDDGLQEIITDRMLNSKYQENTLALEAETARWARRSTTTSKLTSTEITDFPEMTERDLKIYFSGSYQLGQAVCYLVELLGDSDEINLEYIKLKPNIIKVLVRSRHINKKTYKCFIEYQPNSIGYSGILRHCCDCANGLRTVGCCSHIATVIYYLSNARYKSRIIKPSKILSQLFSSSDVDPVINEDSDED